MGRDDRGTGPDGGGHEPASESAIAADDRERLYARVSEEIGAGSQVGTGRRGGGPARPVTPAFVLGAVILAVSLIVLALGAYPFIFGAVLGEPFQYTNLPFPVCDPAIAYTSPEDCTKPAPGFQFLPGQGVPMLFGKCYTDPFGEGRDTTYTVHRRLVSDQNGVQISIGDTFASAKEGCALTRMTEHAIPTETPSGLYHFEGFSEIRSWRQMNVLWRSASFAVQGT